ncbi:MAG TPA: CPBP family intramembrane glutamic endopeptidase [Thermoanaerobaculia bacterium]
MKQLAESRPVLFSMLVTITFVLLVAMIAITGKLAGDVHQLEAIGALGRLCLALLGLAGLLYLGWRDDLGIWPVPSIRTWIPVFPALLYVLLVYPPLFTGGYAFNITDRPLAVLVALNGFAAGVMEEIFFRGLVLGSFLKSWGLSPRVIVRSLVVSALLFSVPHALNVLAGVDPLRVSAQLIWAFLLGVVFAGLLVIVRSIWPIALLHGFANAVVHVNRIGHEVTPTTTSALLMALAPLPLLLYVWILLKRRLPKSARSAA